MEVQKALYKAKKSFELFLGAGSGCNMHCKYCFAGHQDCSGTKAKPVINEELVLKQLHKYGINENGRAIIWGGEPLHNEEALKVAVAFVRKHWADMEIQIVTNGLALNKDWVKFMNDNRIILSFSHDGCGQKYRGYDYLQDDKYLRLIRQLDCKKSFHYVLHRHNNDARAINDYFHRVEDRFGENIGVTGGPMRHTNPYTLEFLPRHEDGTIQKVCESAIYIVEQGLDGKDLRFNSWLLRKFGKYLHLALFGERVYTKPFCGAADIACIGLDGREFLCHAEAERLANDFDATPTTLKNFKFSRMCRECDMFQLCGGVCAAIPDEEYRKANCDFNKAWNSTLYLYAVRCLNAFGVDHAMRIISGQEEEQDGSLFYMPR